MSVAIIMGSQSDYPIMKKAVEILTDFGVENHVEIISAHRTPIKMLDFAKTAQEKGFKVIIAGAGGAAHLPGMIASLTILPVIGVPINITALNGLDSLLSIVQMPKGIPVATVAIDNAENAGVLATRILATSDTKYQKLLQAYQQTQKNKVQEMNKTLKL